jgi:hypothetical protein
MYIPKIIYIFISVRKLVLNYERSSGMRHSHKTRLHCIITPCMTVFVVLFVGSSLCRFHEKQIQNYPQFLKRGTKMETIKSSVSMCFQ